MLIMADAFRLPKAGNADDEYEDAARPRRPVCRTTRTFRAAVADGATEASFAGLWAEQLARAYGAGWFDRHPLPGGLDRLRARWRKGVGDRPLPWYAEQKLAAGVGLTVTDDGRWRAMAVGDCNLFHVRGGQVIDRFPLTAADQFGSRPALISTDPASNRHLGQAVRTTAGTWEAGDEFYLMTDALACWFVGRLDAGGDPLADVGAINSAGKFAAFVCRRRQADEQNPVPLTNDDTTMVRCQVEVQVG